jgi:hypothetical protein
MSVGPPGSYSRDPAIIPELYDIDGDVRTGLHATVGYRVAWADAVQFAYNALRSPSAVVIGGITWFAPYRLPLLVNGVQPPLYCQGIKIKPQGASGSMGTTGGINPPEYFTDAIVTLKFDNVGYLQGVSDDPSALSQLDPTNPITACEQSAKIIGNMQTRKGAAYTYDSNSKPVPGEIGVNRNQVKLSLSFPRVPYLPWSLIEPYVGKVNNTAILLCNKGSLLLEGLDTNVSPSLTGFNQKVGLQFAFNPDWTGASAGGLDWNSQELPDGSGVSLVSAAGGGGQRPYAYKEFRSIFTGLSFS